MQAEMQKQVKQPARKQPIRRLRNATDRTMFLFALPMLILVFIYCYVPMAGLIIAFKNYNYRLGMWGSPFIGMKNFEFFFSSPDLWRIVRNTLGYNLAFIALGLVGGVTMAILLYEVTSRKALKAYQTLMFIPYFLSWVVVSYIVYAFLNPRLGIVNQLLRTAGREALDWYNNPAPWPWLIIGSNLWKNIGMSTLMYYASMMGIDATYYEAATLEGANKLQLVRYITLPFLLPLAIILMILDVGKIFNSDFGLFYQLPMNSTMLYSSTDVIETYVFRALMEHGNIGMSSAVGFVKSIMGFILVTITNISVKKIDPEYALY